MKNRHVGILPTSSSSQSRKVSKLHQGIQWRWRGFGWWNTSFWTSQCKPCDGGLGFWILGELLRISSFLLVLLYIAFLLSIMLNHHSTTMWGLFFFPTTLSKSKIWYIVVWNDSLQNLTMQHVEERDWICSVVSSFGLSIQSTSKDAIRRYGGSTAPSMPWPPEHEDGTLSLRPFFAEWKQQIYQIWWPEWKYSGLYFLSPSLCIYIYIPGTQMTLILNGVQAFFWRVLSPQNRVDQQFHMSRWKIQETRRHICIRSEKLLKMHMCMENLSSRELTYPPKMAFWRWFSFSQGGIC